MYNYKIALKIEIIKLFRRSNVLFFFLIFYLSLTPLSSTYQLDNIANDIDFFKNFSIKVSIFSLLIMAIFFVNNVGNDFNEGSYRKLIAMGLTKNSYLTGKIVLVLLFTLFIVFYNLVLYYIAGTIDYNFTFIDFIKSISFSAILNQITALICAGLFGLFFITVFRNRIIGLVFFPLWLSLEFYFKLLEKVNDVQIVKFFPGNAFFNLFVKYTFVFEKFIIAILIGFLFLIACWAGLKYREEPGSNIQ